MLQRQPQRQGMLSSARPGRKLPLRPPQHVVRREDVLVPDLSAGVRVCQMQHTRWRQRARWVQDHTAQAAGRTPCKLPTSATSTVPACMLPISKNSSYWGLRSLNTVRVLHGGSAGGWLGISVKRTRLGSPGHQGARGWAAQGTKGKGAHQCRLAQWSAWCEVKDCIFHEQTGTLVHTEL